MTVYNQQRWDSTSMIFSVYYIHVCISSVNALRKS
jgi:hypothetical protein